MTTFDYLYINWINGVGGGRVRLTSVVRSSLIVLHESRVQCDNWALSSRLFCRHCLQALLLEDSIETAQTRSRLTNFIELIRVLVNFLIGNYLLIGKCCRD